MTALTGEQRAAFDADGYLDPFDLFAADEVARRRRLIPPVPDVVVSTSPAW